MTGLNIHRANGQSLKIFLFCCVYRKVRRFMLHILRKICQCVQGRVMLHYMSVPIQGLV